MSIREQEATRLRLAISHGAIDGYAGLSLAEAQERASMWLGDRAERLAHQEAWGFGRQRRRMERKHA